MKTFELYWKDLTPEAQKRFLDTFGDNGNYDLIPMAVIEVEDGEEEG